MALDFLLEPERLEAARGKQAELRTKNSHVTARSPAHANYLVGVARVNAALAKLKVKREDAKAVEQLAEGYALMGAFEEAAAFSLDEQKKAQYRLRAEAVSHIGVPSCMCPPTVRVQSNRDAKGEERETRRVIEEVWIEGRTVQITKCDLCGALSAR